MLKLFREKYIKSAQTIPMSQANMMYEIMMTKRNGFDILKTALRSAKQYQALYLLENAEALVRESIALHN